MNQKNEYAKMIAAECIRQSEEGNYERGLFRRAGELIQQLLAEPVAYGRWHEDGGYIDMVFLDKEECSQYLDDDEEPVALFAAPPPPANVPLLTGEEIVAAIASAKQITTAYAGWVRDQRIEYGRSIEQAVRQKAGLK